MTTSTRTLNLTIPIDTLKNYIEPVLYTLKKIKPREEIVSLEIEDLPWNTGQDIPIKVTVRQTKEVAMTAVEDAG